MAFSLVANATAQGQSGPATSAINTTGADLIVVSISSYSTSPGTLTDSKSNTWTSLTASDASTGARSRIWYCVAPTVGSGHTFTLSGSNVYASFSVTAWSGAASSSTFDVQNGATSASSTTISTGSVTPSNDNSLLVYGAGYDSTNTTSSVNVGTLQHAQAGVSSVAFGGGMGYQIQTTATARNPQFTFSGAAVSSARIAVFKAAASAGSHAATGALSADAATVSGTAAHLTLHAATGALGAQASSISAAATRSRLHASSGAIAAQDAQIGGTATRIVVHASSGELTAQAAAVSGTAARTSPGAHPSTGALAVDAATISGAATHLTLHSAVSEFVASHAALSGIAVHDVVHTSSGILLADAASISSVAQSTGGVAGATAAEIWGYVMSNGETAEANVVAIRAALDTLTAAAIADAVWAKTLP